MPAMLMDHQKDPRDEILNRIGDLSGVEVFNNQVLLAVYMRPKNVATKGGLYLPETTVDEDRYQSKVGLLLSHGAAAFVDDGRWFSGVKFNPGHDWLVFRPSDGWAITINGVLCRMFDDIQIKARVAGCDDAW